MAGVPGAILETVPFPRGGKRIYDTESGRTISRVRPKWKTFYNVSVNSVGGTSMREDVFTATKACTIRGLRWALSFSRTSTSSFPTYYRWALMHQKGSIGGTVSSTFAQTTFAPEEGVMAWGMAVIKAGDKEVEGWESLNSSSTASRKFKKGDTLELIVGMAGLGAAETEVDGVIQLIGVE